MRRTLRPIRLAAPLTLALAGCATRTAGIPSASDGVTRPGAVQSVIVTR